jgi:hypothetical protein
MLLVARRPSVIRYAWMVLAGLAVAVGGSLYVRQVLTPPMIALPAKDIGQRVFNPSDPADGWMIATPRKPSTLRYYSRLYRSTNGGLNWHRVLLPLSNRYQMILEAGKKTSVLVHTARHDPSLAAFPNEWATVYFPTMQSAGTVEPIRATTRPTVPWASYETFLMPPQTSNAPWLLAESIGNPGSSLFTLFHWNASQTRWVAVTPIPLAGGVCLKIVIKPRSSEIAAQAEPRGPCARRLSNDPIGAEPGVSQWLGHRLLPTASRCHFRVV